MALQGKTILCSVKDKFEALRELLRSMITDLSGIVTLIYGEDVKESEATAILEEFESIYPKVDFDLVNGGQPVYSFIVGVE